MRGCRRLRTARCESLSGVSGMGCDALRGVRVLRGEVGPFFRAGLVRGSGEGSFAPGLRMPGEGVPLKGDAAASAEGEGVVEAAAMLWLSLAALRFLGGGVCWRF